MSENNNLLMVVVSGRDRPGITATFSRILYDHNIEVVDIEGSLFTQSVGSLLIA